MPLPTVKTLLWFWVCGNERSIPDGIRFIVGKFEVLKIPSSYPGILFLTVFLFLILVLLSESGPEPPWDFFCCCCSRISVSVSHLTANVCLLLWENLLDPELSFACVLCNTVYWVSGPQHWVWHYGFLKKLVYGPAFKGISCIIVDPWDGCKKITGTIHGLSVHDLRKGHMETHVEVLSLFVHRGHSNLSWIKLETRREHI